MYTIFIGLRLNQMGLHRGKKRLAFGQSQPNRLWSLAFVGRLPVIISCV
jgi:hypothetical protein